jgi:hypothetical protein
LGFTHTHAPEQDGKDVMRISAIVGHRLETDWETDQGPFFGCRAEKGLVVLFVDTHVVVPGDDEELQRVKLLVLFSQATITVSRSLWDNWLRCADAVGRCFGVAISVLDRSEEY